MEKRIRFTIILVLILIVVIAFSFQSKEKKEYLVYNEALDKTAVTVDDVSLTLKDIAFYVAYEEKTVQEQAILYNPDNPRQYWNVYTDGQFVKLTAKQAALDMAVHDEIFYQMAVAEGVKLDVTEQEYLENDESDFWSDLEDWQREQLGISEAVSYTHLRAHETDSYFVCRLLLEKKKTRMPSSASKQDIVFY